MQKLVICLFVFVCFAGGEAHAQRFSYGSYGSYGSGITLSLPRLGISFSTGGNSWNNRYSRRQPYYTPSQWHGPSYPNHKKFYIPPVTTYPRRQPVNVPPVGGFTYHNVPQDIRQFVVPPVTTHRRRHTDDCLSPLPWVSPSVVSPQYQNGHRGYRFDKDDYEDYLEDLEDQQEDWLKQLRKQNRENEKRQKEALKLQQDWHRQQLKHWNDYHR